ncbi:MAG: quinoprotein dehydrogenase-associated SoxYZ-like carrier [Rhizobium sp.]|nr:quinoprotein dehydrogenase-associated SoxYZ-like carrier [Rhizobium sp.]
MRRLSLRFSLPLSFSLAFAVGTVLIAPASAAEDDPWPAIRQQLYGNRPIAPGNGTVSLEAPYRSANDARTAIGATLAAPDGQSIRAVTLVLDENPMPVSAIFHLSRPMARFAFEATVRVNGPTPVHVVAELTNGELVSTEGFVKTSGLGACAAPPGSDPEIALATLGDMTIDIGHEPRGSSSLLGEFSRLRNQQASLNLGISHPSHSGMQMDQITLLFIPMRYVETINIDLDGQSFVEVTGSISLSENPEFRLSIPAATQVVDVTMTDTNGTVSRKTQRLTSY